MFIVTASSLSAARSKNTISRKKLRRFWIETLDMEAIPVAPGIFFIFRDKILEQRFLLDQQRRIQFPLATELRPPLDRQSLAERRLEALRPLLERLWHRMLNWSFSTRRWRLTCC